MSDRNTSLFAKVYLDEDVHKRVADGLRLRGFDVVSSHEIGRKGMTDQQQLDYAISQECLLVTFNVSDYVKLGREYAASGKRHYGIALSRQLPVGEMVRRLLELLDRFTVNWLKDNLWWL